MVTRTDFHATEYAMTFHRDGYFIRNDVVADEMVQRLRLAVAAIPNRQEVRRRRNVFGVRNLLEICAAIRVLATESIIREFVPPVLGDKAFEVRAIFFDNVQGS